MKKRAGIAIALLALLGLGLGCDFFLHALRWSFSSAVLGMVALLGLVIARGRVDTPLERAAHLLLRWFPLFFVPACVGVMEYGAVIAHAWLGLAVALVGSTLLGIVAAASVGTLLARNARA